MSVDRTAMIIRGFEIDKDTWESLDDDFKDDWGINFDNWHSYGPFYIGYRVQTCSEGKAYALTTKIYHPDMEDMLKCACRDADINVPVINTYFGVAVW